MLSLKLHNNLKMCSCANRIKWWVEAMVTMQYRYRLIMSHSIDVDIGWDRTLVFSDSHTQSNRSILMANGK